MKFQSDKVVNSQNDSKLLLVIGITGSICMALSAILETNKIGGSMLIIMAYLVTIPIMCATMGTFRESLFADYPKAKDDDRLAGILLSIQGFIWLFNGLDYYLNNNHIWAFSLCTCMLLNGIYGLFVIELRKDIVAHIGPAISCLLGINCMIFDGIDLSELFWLASLGFFLSIIFPNLWQLFRKNKGNTSIEDVPFPE